jgi:type I restriction enzyme, R subunit
LFDVLEYIAFYIQPTTRENRVSQAKPKILEGLRLQQRDFLEFVLFKFIDTGVEELDQANLPGLIELKYHSLDDGMSQLGGVKEARGLFFSFQKHLYENSPSPAC